ncbi:cytochrome c oxidase subunit 3 [Mycobacterium sp. AZCC_0083]|uniref:cytochrome c oxidase subunit 3 n=1 Tax=Mycobacterium sp. AZCC_0083 TaxID=2735882 RepID=UPI0017981253|nr:cytochrome c oxidase subunit 3 [Mycobacterium sp. AZCC_0083]MBB5161569.1 nitric oxide reductase NorE protein [Mycobacterium sp. AZCC_0083]
MQLTPSDQGGPLTATTSRGPRKIPGEAGIWVFIFGDLLFFAYLFLLYLYYRAGDPELFARSQRHLNTGLGVAYTLLLLTSSLFAVIALRLIRARSAGAATYFVLAAMGCGVAFVGMKVVEYYTKVNAGVTPGTNYFYLFYYVLTGLHLAHVAIGLGVLVFMWWLARHAPHLSALQLSLAEGCACFWHMVDLLWLVIFPLLYLVR